MLPPFELERPDTVADVVALLGEDAVPYCGGTELLLAMKMGLLRPAVLVDVKRVATLRGVRREAGRLVIGASTTHAEVAADPLVTAEVPLLATVAHHVGNARVRAQGSIGGNLCFAEPKSDVTTVLAALDATVTLVSPRGPRSVAVAGFLIGAYWADREADELLTEVSIPLPAPKGAYLKLQTAERPTVGVAAVRTATGLRLAVGAVGERPVVVDHDGPGAPDFDTLAEGIEMIPDLAGSVRYKRHVTAVYARRAATACEERTR
ncbi:xanthine dehydrogenase family protein subunit M [Amycolatopsis sp. FDAARGOS 1241]|uniref:FAD binding domain-containing protein n=1 Tax=Amycolatopsis sp. FDAARGOS 1241 TaxID=2778070 RepID=UPI00194F6204|nr:FAD binding domain-containing protein [Amycolatopsis sp. FDAARGOS 1241]QRP48658.1 FAD binding domain-containing protein [Amycolatopsis sp. FDAARGOS 1241]